MLVVIQLKLVCKRLYSLISSDYFITFYRHCLHDPSVPPIYDPNPLAYSVLYQIRNKTSLGGYDNSSLVGCQFTHHGTRLYKLDLSFLLCPEAKIELEASCADLILCSFRDNLLSQTTVFYYVCNLQTKQWVALPPAPYIKDQPIGLLCVPPPCSLCHSSKCVDNPRYKFMVVRFPIPRHVGLFEFDIELFLSKDYQWRKHEALSPVGFPCNRHPNPTVVPYKGMLHWLYHPYVLVIDPYNSPEKFSCVIDLPSNSRDNVPISFGVCQDRLRISLICEVVNCFFYMFKLVDSDLNYNEYYILELEDYDMGKWSTVHKNCTDDDLNFSGPEDLISSVTREYIHLDGNAVGRVNSSMCLCYLQSGVMDRQYKYKLILDEAHEMILSSRNVIQIDHQWWPIPVPTLKLNLQPSLHN